MPRFYMHLRDFDGALTQDIDGSEFPSLAVAKKHALRDLHEIVGDAIKQGEEPPVEALVICDEQGAQLVALPLIAALPPKIVGLLKHPEKILPTNKFLEYGRLADECRAMAEDTIDPDDKMSWLKLANAWLHMLPSSHVKGDIAGWPKATDEDSKASH